ncbi:MAG: SEC-C metal-binding domain-containing protein [Candidatus Rhabdochlamydia sp.]
MKNIGRNDVCLCGSGKKFKKCCENKSPYAGIKNVQIMAQDSSMITLFQRKIIVSSEASNESE